MSFIRPEARAAVVQWREAVIGAAVLLLGLWGASGFGLVKWLGVALVALGAVLIVSGLQRGRFRTGSGGPGVVQVDEGQVAYFGPLNGGSVAVRSLSRVVLDGRSRPAVWALYEPGQAPLHIPVNAAGAEALFDAFASLEGMRTEHMLQQLKAVSDQPVVIWTKGDRDSQGRRLH
ncbi:hypothetical protein [Shimia marina]|uniref:Uncharacterized protein n=1 Tax=Shimia marina TaxID=321267 RepID=A0A0P1EQY3_9RHOB|nr:hypothetical protein [Shimia marina]CUH52591.1 hypothetical protein SHM7688_02038 [Shimia marina]SFE50963.1 hypothetical protein SAMN04488037_11090 [Shimia marina]